MFATTDGTIQQLRERRREARRCELLSICEQQARLAQRVTQIVREADDDGDGRPRAAARARSGSRRLSSSDHRAAQQITRTSSALRGLPALDHALSTGALSLDQVAAAAEFATPETDSELARVAVGKAPSQIALAARTLVPPTVQDDEQLYRRRALSMVWTSRRSGRQRRSSVLSTSRQDRPSTGGSLHMLVFRPALRIHEAKTCLDSRRVVGG